MRSAAAFVIFLSRWPATVLRVMEANMSEYIHHVAGRLRLKLAQVKRNPARAHEIQAAVCRIAGVTSTHANSVTGSLVIYYDTKKTDFDTILGAMRATGVVPASGAAENTPPHAAALATLTGKLADMFTEKLIERSAIALLGALL